MNRTHRRDSMPMLLAIGTTVLVASLWSAAYQRDALTAAPDAALPVITDEPVSSTDATPPRRLNSSLSMPYFSFAQSLNSRC